MKFKNYLLIILICLIWPFSGFAFDRINCESSLYDWSVWNGRGKKNKVLFALRPSIQLAEIDSRVLIVKDERGNNVAEILPWDGIDLVMTSKQTKYKFDSDNLSWFEITFQDKYARKLLCRLSF